MPNENSGPYIGLLSFLSFGFSVIAAVLAIDMYRLLRTGEYGRTWRLLIITSVMFSLMQALRMGDFFNITALNTFGLAQIVELVFVISLAYTFYLQRRVFTLAARLRQREDHYSNSIEAPEAADNAPHEEEWNRTADYYAGYQENADTERLLNYSEAHADDDDIEWSPRSSTSAPTSRTALPSNTPSTPKPQS